MKTQIENGRVLFTETTVKLQPSFAIAYVKQVVCIQWMDTKQLQILIQW